jgi:hypothetical protein
MRTCLPEGFTDKVLIKDRENQDVDLPAMSSMNINIKIIIKFKYWIRIA